MEIKVPITRHGNGRSIKRPSGGTVLELKEEPLVELALTTRSWV